MLRATIVALALMSLSLASLATPVPPPEVTVPDRPAAPQPPTITPDQQVLIDAVATLVKQRNDAQNDAALCEGRAVSSQRTIADLTRKLQEANETIKSLREAVKPGVSP